jgi:DnaJ family protein C protein 3
VKDYRSALDKDEDFSRAKEGIQKAQKLEKQAKKRDYYKILGVKRTASKKEINKASSFYFFIFFMYGHNMVRVSC